MNNFILFLKFESKNLTPVLKKINKRHLLLNARTYPTYLTTFRLWRVTVDSAVERSQQL